MPTKVIVTYLSEAPQVCEIERLTPTGRVRWAEGRGPVLPQKRGDTRPHLALWTDMSIWTIRRSIYPYSEEALARLRIRQERYREAKEILREAERRRNEITRLADAACGLEPFEEDGLRRALGAPD